MRDARGYLARMDKTLSDKLFWLDKINPDEISIIVDFGCGGGTLLSKVRQDPRFKDKIFVGIDSNLDFEKDFWMAMGVPRHTDPKIKHFTSPEAINKYLNSDRVLLIFSSVLHECYSFNTLPFKWHQVKTKYVVIRDMFTPISALFEEEIPTKDKLKIFTKADKKQFYDHFKRRGWNFKYGRNWVEFLMKYHYKNNWETEREENYFATDWYAIETYLDDNNFYKLYQSTYNIPWLVNKARRDFGFTYSQPTHRSVIYYKPSTVTKPTKDKYAQRFWFMKEARDSHGEDFLICSEDLAYAYLWELCERIQEELSTSDDTERKLIFLSYMQQCNKFYDKDWMFLGQAYFNLRPEGVYYGSN